MNQYTFSNINTTLDHLQHQIQSNYSKPFHYFLQTSYSLNQQTKSPDYLPLSRSPNAQIYLQYHNPLGLHLPRSNIPSSYKDSPRKAQKTPDQRPKNRILDQSHLRTPQKSKTRSVTPINTTSLHKRKKTCDLCLYQIKKVNYGNVSIYISFHKLYNCTYLKLITANKLLDVRSNTVYEYYNIFTVPSEILKLEFRRLHLVGNPGCGNKELLALSAKRVVEDFVREPPEDFVSAKMDLGNVSFVVQRGEMERQKEYLLEGVKGVSDYFLLELVNESSSLAIEIVACEEIPQSYEKLVVCLNPRVEAYATIKNYLESSKKLK